MRVHLVTMESDEVLRNHAVVVRDERIVWMGPSAEAPLEDVDVIVEAPGRHLMPGLVDMHVLGGTRTCLFSSPTASRPCATCSVTLFSSTCAAGFGVVSS